MLTLRRTLGLLLLCLALLCGLMTLAASGSSVEYSVAKSREIDRRFRLAAASITAFERDHGRLPSPAEFHAVFPQGDDQVFFIRLAEPGSDQCDEASGTYSRLRGRDYVLSVWRGEWTECYAPSKGMSTLSLNPADYTMLGSVARDQSSFAAAGIACLLLAMLLWRRWGRSANNTPRDRGGGVT